jgi:hypothetical protein
MPITVMVVAPIISSASPQAARSKSGKHPPITIDRLLDSWVYSDKLDIERMFMFSIVEASEQSSFARLVVSTGVV